jgi:hypothetical protein
VCTSASIFFGVGGEFLRKENEDVITATTGQGDTSMMVCRTDEGSSNQKICMDVDTQAQMQQARSQMSPSENMLNNATYNLMEQLLVENKSLWRIKNNYKSDSAMDTESKQLWDIIEKDKEEVVRMLKEKLRERL